MPADLLAALRHPSTVLPGEPAVYERVAQWINVEAVVERDEAIAESARLTREVERLREPLLELVTLKDGPRDAEYERRKPLAWQAAREALREAETEAKAGGPGS